MGLSQIQRAERLANLPHLRYRHRSGFALSQLKAAGYVENPTAGIWHITDFGRTLLSSFPEGFDQETARRLIQAGRRDQTSVDGATAAEASNDSIVESTPDERIDDALEEIHGAVAATLLDKIAKSPPIFFEQLVLDLLHALGYGTNREALERVGKTSDGGIDGIISLDKLGFERVYVQAKRWQGSVGRPEIQAFFGALTGRRARKGVFITTSSFTREAREFGDQVSENVVLIDGRRLTSLMIASGVGVTHYKTLHLPKVDDDYFDAD